MDSSIIIVSWNTEDLLRKCLDSIRTNPPAGDFEVFVVDNASSDQSVKTVRDLYPEVTLIHNEVNVGFAQANNQAISKSQGRYIILLNPDTRVEAGAFKILTDYMDSHPEIGAVGPQLLNPDGTLQPSCYPVPTLSREFWRLLHLDTLKTYGIYPMDTWDLETSREVEVIQGACLVLRKESLEQIGLLDQRYFIYSEEVDLCYRLLKAGWGIVWIPRARVVHYGGQSTKQVKSVMFLHLYQSKVQFFKKNYSWWRYLLYKLILGIASLVRLSLVPFVFFEPADRRQEHLSLIRNYLALLRVLPHY